MFSPKDPSIHQPDTSTRRVRIGQLALTSYCQILTEGFCCEGSQSGNPHLNPRIERPLTMHATCSAPKAKRSFLRIGVLSCVISFLTLRARKECAVAATPEWNTAETKRVLVSQNDLMIVTIDKDGKRCTPRVSPGQEWCVPPV